VDINGGWPDSENLIIGGLIDLKPSFDTIATRKIGANKAKLIIHKI
jgi:hypothetical protein